MNGTKDPTDPRPPEKPEGTSLTKWEKFGLAFLGSAILNIIWFLKQYQEMKASTNGALDEVLLMGFVVLGLLVCITAGLLVKDSLDTAAWRFVVQGVTLPSLIMGLVSSNIPSIKIINPEVIQATEIITEETIFSQYPLGNMENPKVRFTLISQAFAQGGSGSEPLTKPLPTPTSLDKFKSGFQIYLGRYSSNWYVESGRYETKDEAWQRAEEITKKGFEATVYRYADTKKKGNGSKSKQQPFIIILGIKMSPMEARRLQDDAGLKNIPTTAFQLS